MRKSLALLALAAGILAAAPAHAAIDWRQVDQALGRSGSVSPDGVRRYSFPRTDLEVLVDDVRVEPALALGSWLAFREMGDHGIVMGDLVLLHDEVNSVLSELLRGGLTISALHNHLLRASPGTMYMHIHGHGDPAQLARTIRAALERSRTPLAAPPAGSQAAGGFDPAPIERILGRGAEESGGVYKFSIPRSHPVVEGGHIVPSSMGLGTVIAFQPTGEGKAAVTGDFVLTASEITPVLRTLRANGIDVTALHNHLTDEQPRLFFMHFWGHDDASRVAEALRQALAHLAVAGDR